MGKFKLNILDSHKGVDCNRLLLYSALILHDKVFDPSNTLFASKHAYEQHLLTYAEVVVQE